jgi:hypothetical protein
VKNPDTGRSKHGALRFEAVHFLFRQPVEVSRDGQMSVAFWFINRFLGVGQAGNGIRPIVGSFSEGQLGRAQAAPPAMMLIKICSIDLLVFD